MRHLKKGFTMIMGVILIAGLVGIAAPRAEAAKYVMKFAHNSPPKPDMLYTAAATTFQNYLRIYTAGEADTQIFPLLPTREGQHRREEGPTRIGADADGRDQQYLPFRPPDRRLHASLPFQELQERRQGVEQRHRQEDRRELQEEIRHPHPEFLAVLIPKNGEQQAPHPEAFRPERPPHAHRQEPGHGRDLQVIRREHHRHGADRGLQRPRPEGSSTARTAGRPGSGR